MGTADNISTAYRADSDPSRRPLKLEGRSRSQGSKLVESTHKAGETARAHLTIPDDTFQRLAQRAAERNTAVEQLITPLLELAVGGPVGQQTALLPEAPLDDWKKKFDDWMADVQARAGRYPAGFVMDDSRESIYEGCGKPLKRKKKPAFARKAGFRSHDKCGPISV
jgi:hypothetical protein